MNFEHVKKLVKYNRYGKVIRLIKNNIHIWSLKDYCRIYNICSGICVNRSKVTYAEICILYMLDYLPDTIIKHVTNAQKRSIKQSHNNGPYYYGSIRLIKHKKMQDIEAIVLYNVHNDTATHYIKTRQITIHNLTIIPIKLLLYDECDLITILKHMFSDRYKIDYAYRCILNFYLNRDFDTAFQLQNKLILIHKFDLCIGKMHKYRDLYNYIDNCSLHGFFAIFKENGFKYKDMMTLRDIYCHCCVYGKEFIEGLCKYFDKKNNLMYDSKNYIKY